MIDIDSLKRIAEVEFYDIVKDTNLTGFKLRVILVDNSFVDIYLSKKLPDKFGFHWERMDYNGTVFRYDNFPDRKWYLVQTFPYHFHNGSQNTVEASPFPLEPVRGFRAFMEFIKGKLIS